MLTTKDHSARGERLLEVLGADPDSPGKAQGVAPSRCIHTHPIKRDSDIRDALRFGVTTFVADNPEEIKKFVRYRKRVELLLRDDDARLEAELLADPKERAEHLMLVDLGRNDLGRVCRYDSVKVDRFAFVERYSHVMHIVSSVSGLLDRQRGAMDVLAACFPAGTVSGAPKVRAMQIINELEPTPRGPGAWPTPPRAPAPPSGATSWLSTTGTTSRSTRSTRTSNPGSAAR